MDQNETASHEGHSHHPSVTPKSFHSSPTKERVQAQGDSLVRRIQKLSKASPAHHTHHSPPRKMPLSVSVEATKHSHNEPDKDVLKSTMQTESSYSAMQNECVNLLRTRQYRSCEIVALFLLSSLEGNGKSPSSSSCDKANSSCLAITLEILGDCCHHTKQYRRAVSYYRKASTQRAHQHDPDAATNNYSESITNVTSHAEANLRLKEARSLSSLGNLIEAATVLEAIPSQSVFRSHVISMELGNLHLASGRSKDAKRSYMDAIKRNPYLLEAIERLALLNVERSEVISVLKQRDAVSKENQNAISSTNESQSKLSQPIDILNTDILPITDIINSHFLSHRNQRHSSAMNQWRKLDNLYPNNLYILQQIGLLLWHCHPLPSFTSTEKLVNPFTTQCDIIFRRIRSIDPYVIEGMDLYASILLQKGDMTELNRLSHDLLEIDDTRPEPWVCLALYNFAQNDHEKAISFIEKAISCKPRHLPAHVLLGSFLLIENRPEHAVVSFFRANEISRNMLSYEGLVESYLALNKYKEAVCTAKEAITFTPSDSRAFTLVGLAWSRAPTSPSSPHAYGKKIQGSGKERAKKALKKALSLDPMARKPLIILVDLCLEDEDYQNCIDLLNKAIDSNSENRIGFGLLTSESAVSDDKFILFSKLADTHAMSKNYSDALSCYHKALSLNPEYQEALQGLERLEKILEGLVEQSDMNDHDNSGYHE